MQIKTLQVRRMNSDKQIIEIIEQFNTIIICRHIRPDGDAVGASKGLASILKCSFPMKKVLVVNEDFSQFTAFMGPEDNQVDSSVYEDALVIAVDTSELKRISNTYAKNAKNILRIDHHISENSFADFNLVDPNRSSTCEIIADFVRENCDKFKMTKEAAAYLFTGMVTDSGRFKYTETDSNTLRTAAYLMDFGIDVQEIYDNIYLESFEEFSLKGKMYSMIKFTPSKVAYIRFRLEDLARLGITAETASNSVDLMQNIRGTDIWMVFIETPEGTTRVRLRSRRLDVQQLAAKFHGGGHVNASGATCYSEIEVDSLLKEADTLHCLA